MKKENSLAIIFGIIFGIVIALLIIYKQGSQNKTASFIKSIITPTITINTPSSSLTITNPIDNSIVQSSKIKIEGKSKKDNLIIIQSPFNDFASKLTKDSFSIDFSLSPGENIIKITSYNNTETENKTLTVYYLKND